MQVPKHRQTIKTNKINIHRLVIDSEISDEEREERDSYLKFESCVNVVIKQMERVDATAKIIVDFDFT